MAIERTGQSIHVTLDGRSRQPACSRSIDVKAVTDACLGQDVPWPLGAGLDLLAKLSDIDAQILHVGFSAPHLAHQHPVGQYLTGMGNQQAQNVVFLRRKFNFRPVHAYDPPHQIDRQVAVLEDGLLALLLQPVPERGADAGE